MFFNLKKVIFFLTAIFVLCNCRTGRVRSVGDGLPQDLNADGNQVVENADIYEFVEIPSNLENLPVSTFKEVWAYLVGGNENTLKSSYPISDLVYFSAEVDRYGHLVDVPNRKKIDRFLGRVHVSAACNSAGLTHFLLEPGSRARQTILSELIASAANYDGLNMDFELIPARDADNYLSFLADLKAGLGKKMFTVCVPARTRAGGSYNYQRIAAIADRVFVMAYDEHWSNSAPGPVASMNWCKTVASYSLQSIGSEKLIMGIPFYGRGWGDKSTSRGLISSTSERIRKENGIENIKRINGVPTFEYDVTVKVTVYYEDDYSISTRMDMYRKQGVQSIGFWRLGQESSSVWAYLKLMSAGPLTGIAKSVK